MPDPAPRHPFAARAGAVVSERGVDHFGSPLGEQRALAAGRAVVALGDRRVLCVSGPDRLGWLDSITSQAVGALAAGESAELLVLDPHGRIEHAAAVVDDGATTWLILDAGDAPALLAWLARMRFRAAVELRAADELAVLGAVAATGTGPIPSELVARPNGVPLVWRDPWPGVTAGGWAYAPVEPHPGASRPWIEAIVPVAALDELAAGPVAVAGLVAADALRVAA
ncbi:MAG: folate-binding protein, partial [Microbacterium sp.]